MNTLLFKISGLFLAFVMLQAGADSNMIDWARFGLSGLIIAAFFYLVLKPLVTASTTFIGKVAEAIELLSKDVNQINTKIDYLQKDVQELKAKIESK